MSHTVHPYSHRLGIMRDWKSRWFGINKKFRDFLKGDTLIRAYLVKKLRGTYTASIEIERNEKSLRVIVKSARPGMIIGRSGEGAQKLKNDVIALLRKHKLVGEQELKLDIEEIRSPESNAAVVGEMIAEALEKRLPFRRVLKQMVEKVMANRDVLGARIALSGRLGGADMARYEYIKKGRIPLQTLRGEIDFSREKTQITKRPICI